MNTHLEDIYNFEKEALELISKNGHKNVNYIEKLQEFNSLNNITEKEVYQLALSSEKLPKHYYSEKQFGYFNVTLVNNEYFNMQIYIMNDIHTEVHNHAFNGAFKLLAGEAVHKTFQWEESERIDSAVHFGKLSETNSIKFSTGDSCSIQLHTIHQILRIADINITLILIDKKSTPKSAMNGYFLPPSLYIENLDLSDDFKRKIYCLSILIETNQKFFDEELKIFISKRNTLELFSLATRFNSYALEQEYKDDTRKSIIDATLVELKSRNLFHYLEGYFKYIKSQDRKLRFLKS